MILVLSFQSGVVRPMHATELKEAKVEAVDRCRNLCETANIVDAETYAVVARIVYDRGYKAVAP